MYSSFRDMPVWQNALKYSKTVFEISNSLPRSEDYGITSQIRRSANSINGNIFEAYGKKTKNDKSNFYIIARGSAFETQSHLIYGNKVGYFDDKIVAELINDYSELIHELNKILKSLH